MKSIVVKTLAGLGAAAFMAAVLFTLTPEVLNPEQEITQTQAHSVVISNEQQIHSINTEIEGLRLYLYKHTESADYARSLQYLRSELASLGSCTPKDAQCLVRKSQIKNEIHKVSKAIISSPENQAVKRIHELELQKKTLLNQ